MNSLWERKMLSRLIPAVMIVLGSAAGVGATAGGAPVPPAVPSRPLSLAECTAIALENNPQVTSAEQGVISARAGLTRARSSYYPQVSLDAMEGFSDSGIPSYSGPTDRLQQASIGVGQTLWRRGREDSVAQSKASLHAAEFGRTSTLQSLVDQVASDYYSVLATSQLVGVADAGAASAQSHLDQVKARITLGAAAEVDVYPAEDDLARARLDLIDARGNMRLAVARLKNSMGVPPSTDLQVAESAAAEEAEPPSLPQALETALGGRPDVLASAASVDTSRSALNLARIRRGPVADISGGYSQYYDDWRSELWSWDVALSVSYPLFDGYATKADETAARASLARAQADYQRVINQVGLEVESALVEVERTRERVTASAASVAAADARLAAAEGKYQQGIGILIEVIDARVAVTNARASQVQARYDYQTALVGLRLALGTLAVPEAGSSRADR